MRFATSIELNEDNPFRGKLDVEKSGKQEKYTKISDISPEGMS